MYQLLFYSQHPKHCKGRVKRQSQSTHYNWNVWLPVEYLLVHLIKSIMFRIWTPSSLFSPKVKPHGRTQIKNGLKKGLNLIRRWQLHPISIYRSQKWLVISVFLGYYVQSCINEGESLSVLLTCSHLIHRSFLANLIQSAPLKYDWWCQLPQAYWLNRIYFILLEKKASMESAVISLSLAI